MTDIYAVCLSERAVKNLEKVPEHVAIKLQAWVSDVGARGLREVRRLSGFMMSHYKAKELGNAQFV